MAQATSENSTAGDSRPTGIVSQSLALPAGGRSAIDQLFQRISDASPLPDLAREITLLSVSEDASLDELREAVAADPVLVPQLMRRLNSSYYGLNSRVSDLEKAAELLGFRELYNLAMTVVLSRFFMQPGVFGTYSRNGLWNHSVAVATAAHLVSRVTSRGVPGQAFLAGLVHDIGLILIDIHMRRQFSQMVQSLESTIPTCSAERKTYLFDHAELGGYVVERWGLGEAVTDAVQHHHSLDQYDGEHQDLAFIVGIANYLCSRAGVTAMGIPNLPPPPDCVFAHLALDQVALSVIWEELKPTLERASTLAGGPR